MPVEAFQRLLRREPRPRLLLSHRLHPPRHVSIWANESLFNTTTTTTPRQRASVNKQGISLSSSGKATRQVGCAVAECGTPRLQLCHKEKHQ
ncbi:hypothetical protein VTN77DRAFT_8092 [Rasamsonia byssochlamydoides]|uniref:uncharacterized protein n=1 Tax=Rasamsonia byssochlamydoides TaxID=89139 RepID=UPI003742C067